MSNKNELKEYIEEKLKDNFNKLITIKDTDKSKIYIFEHKDSGKKILQRISANRNDDVFRELMHIKGENFVTIFEVCSDEDNVIVLEEYIDGTSLYEILQKDKLNKKTAVKYALDICDALIVLHKTGIIHRDIKPENVIITKENNAVLIDFSIARKISRDDENDTANLGTVGYAAPEQYGITQSNKTTDIYSLGVLLNIMLTGEHPTVTLPEGNIKKIISKATETNISKRYQFAEQMKKDLILFSHI